MHADLVVTNANLLTMNDRQPRATAMAVRRGRIERVGSDDDVLALAGPRTERFDAGGRTIVPGFHDCHVHLLWHGKNLVSACDLVGCASIDELLGRLARFAEANPDGWIVGGGFDQERLVERRFPTRAELDRVSAVRPIFIRRVCYHAAVANSAAIALVTDAERAAGDAAGGLYTETAMGAFQSRVPSIDAAALDRGLRAACESARRTGITSAYSLLESADQLGVLSRVKAQLGGRLPIRVVAAPPEASADVLAAHGVTTGFGDDWLRVGAAKFFHDGSLGARTALLAEPYADDPAAGVGLRIYPSADVFNRRVSKVAAMGFQIAIHAIGDQSVRESIDAIEPLVANGNDRAHHRIEHASILAPDQLDRLARLGIGVTLQPQFVTSDIWTGERVGPRRAPWAYPFRAMINAGVRVGLSSDCPVERLDAFDCLAAAVGRHAWSPEGGLSPIEAIRAYTLGSAWLAGRDDVVGSLEVGKFADFVVLSEDPTLLDADAIRALRADEVYVNGERS